MEFQLITLASLASTQTYLEDLLKKEDLPEGTVVWAFDQYSGYGQEGNQWESQAGENLTFSLLLKPGFLDASAQFLLNQSVAIGVMDYLEMKDGLKTTLQLKWPNDFYVGLNKIGGMILNNAVVGQNMRHSIAGIGININQTSFSSYCPNPTSLKLETGIHYTLQTELQELLGCLNNRYQSLENGAVKKLQRDYLDKLFQLGVEAQYQYDGNVITGTIQGIDEFGRLLVLEKTGRLLCCDIKEIQYML